MSVWFTARQRPDVTVEARGPVERPIETDNGTAERGEFILKDPLGETYPCSSKAFAERYEEIDQ